MGALTIKVYATTVVNGVATGDSVLVTLEIPEKTADGIIDRAEWAAYWNSSNGHVSGNSWPPLLFHGDAAGSVMDGVLYSPDPYTAGSDLYHNGGPLSLLDGSGYNVPAADMNVCYFAGTLIATPQGEVPVESLRVGDEVMTRDHGAQPLVWAASSKVTQADLDLAPHRQPIEIAVGALGHDLPRRPIRVSPQHRVLVADELGEYLISARHLVKAEAPGVTVLTDPGDFTLVHIACAEHEIVLAESAPMESFYTGPMAVQALAPAQRLSLLASFPDLHLGRNPMVPARPFIKPRDYRRMMKAHSLV